MPSFRFLLPALALLLAGPARPPAPATPALWMVRDADTVIYLFGTVHDLRPGMPWFTGRVAQAFAQSDTLVLEIVAPAPEQVQAEVARAAPPAGAPPLPALLPPGYPEKLRAALLANGFAADAFDRSDPWIAATSLSLAPLHRAGYRREAGAEAVLTAAAHSAGKPVEALETQRGQIAMYDRLPVETQVAMLVRVLDGWEGAVASMRRVEAAWASGEVAELARITAEDMNKSGAEVQTALLTRRHAAWADWIAQRLERPGRVFVAVGTGHLAGPGSLQTVLAARKLAVRRLR